MWAVVTETLRILNESAVYLLLGFALAGVLHWLLSRSNKFSDLLSTRGTKSVFLSALFGLPLPLCSCSVLPAGLALRKSGASKGATVSFLISVPETDIVSILITYGLLGPVMAVFRPFAALVTAIVTGLTTNVVDRWTEQSAESGAIAEDETAAEPGDKCDAQRSAVWNILHYGFVSFFDDIIGSLLFGIVLGGIITALLPSFGLERFADQSLLAMLAMLVVGIPMYVCATSSTPIAVGLIAGGISPGAALVFLLAGPATNMASLVVLWKHLGKPVLVVYLCSIALVSVLMGLWFDAFIGSGGVSLPAVAPLAAESSFAPLKVGGSLVLAVMAVLSFRRTAVLESALQRLGRRTGLPLSTRRVGYAALVGVLLVYVGSGFFVINPGERGVVTRFGRITRANLGPGLHYRWPYPIARADIEPVAQVKRIELGFRLGAAASTPAASAAYERTMRGESWMLTGNEDIIDIEWVVQYQVVDSEAGLLEYLYGIGDPERLVRDSAEAAIRAAVGCRDIDTLLTTKRHAVEAAVKNELLQPVLDRCRCGIRVLKVSLIDVHAAPEVHWAFRDVASAAEDKMRSINTAYEYEERVVRQAKGEAAKRVLSAEGQAVETVQTAQGAGAAFRDQWAAYTVARAVTRLRLYFEAMDAVLPKLEKYLHGADKPTRGLDLWMIKDRGETDRTGLPQIQWSDQP